VVADVVAVTGQPSGNVILANPIFGSGASVGTGYAVFVGNAQTVTVTGLTNGQTYHFKVFTQSGNTWSNGVSVQATPFNTQSLPLRSIASVIGVGEMSNSAIPEGSSTTVSTVRPSIKGFATPASTGVTKPIQCEESFGVSNGIFT
jgi:hypothetical protein